MPVKKYNTEEERHEAEKASMRKYAKYKYETCKKYRDAKKEKALQRYHDNKEVEEKEE